MGALGTRFFALNLGKSPGGKKHSWIDRSARSEFYMQDKEMMD